MRTHSIAPRHRLLLLSVACGGLLGLAGCGGDDEPEPSAARQEAEEVLRDDLVGDLAPGEADCVIDSLPDYSEETYQEIVDGYAEKGGGAPPEVAVDAGSATVDCTSD